MRRIVQAVAVSVQAGAFAVGCTSGTDPSRERERFADRGSEPLVIGAPWPWVERPDLLYGQGLELAVEQANAEGGVNGRSLRIRQVDDGGATDRARLVAQELADDPNVVAVIGHHQSHVTAAAAPIYELAGLVMLSATSAIPALDGQGYRYVFQTPFTGLDVGRSIAGFALAHGCRRLAIYYSRDEHGRDLANAFEEQAVASGGHIVARESTDPTEPTSTLGAARVATGWQDRLIDAVFLATPHKQAVAMAVELRNRGFRGPFLGSDALAAPGFIDAGGAAVNGTVYATSFTPDAPGNEVRRFGEAFERRYDRTPDVTAALAYDAVGVLVHAMREAGSALPDAVAAALHDVREWRGVTGAFTFGPHGGRADPTINLAIIREGRARALVDRADAPTCAAQADAAVPAW